ncbi:hypothetical protein SprV_0602086700 [Sparganum proliferum]
MASLALILTTCLLLLCQRSVAVELCKSPPRNQDLQNFLTASPIILTARMMELLKRSQSPTGSKWDVEFDASVLVVGVLKAPEGFRVPSEVLVRGFVMPTKNNKYVGTSERHAEPAYSRFGCMEYFHANAAYTLMLKVGQPRNDWPGSRADLMEFDLVGPLLPYNAYYNRHILDLLCVSCYPPKVTQFQRRVMNFGENFNATCVVQGNPLPEVAWFKGAYQISTVTEDANVRVEIVTVDKTTRHAILEITGLLILDNGDYSCRASNTLGTASSTLQLRVSASGISQSEKDNIMDVRELIPCPEVENHCMNGGECFANKKNPLEKTCSCKDGFMGDQCQFRTSGIAVLSSRLSDRKLGTREFILQLLVQCILIILIGCLIVGLILIWRCKDRREKQRRRLQRIRHETDRTLILTNKAVQVNTYEPPPPRNLRGSQLPSNSLPSRRDGFPRRQHPDIEKAGVNTDFEPWRRSLTDPYYLDGANKLDHRGPTTPSRLRQSRGTPTGGYTREHPSALGRAQLINEISDDFRQRPAYRPYGASSRMQRTRPDEGATTGDRLKYGEESENLIG